MYGTDIDEQIDEQSIVIATTDSVTPPDRAFWLDDDMFPVIEGVHYPAFSVQEVAKTFFGREADWLRWRMKPDKPIKATGEIRHPKGFFVLDGEPMQFKRRPVTYDWYEDKNGNEVDASKAIKMREAGRKAAGITKHTEVDHEADNNSNARYYTLADVERMAHALAQQGIIDGLRTAHIVTMVRCCARLYGVVI